MIRLKPLLEQSESIPTISGIEIMQNKLTPTRQTDVNVSGVLNVVNCESATGTYTVNDKRYDMALVQQALGTDTTIRVYAMNPGDTALTLISCLPSSKAKFLVNPRTADFAAPYGKNPG